MTANGADGFSGFCLSYSASSVVIFSSQRSSSSAGLAFSAGNEPTTPALHWAITKSGFEIMKSGAATTGIFKFFDSMDGSAISFPFIVFSLYENLRQLDIDCIKELLPFKACESS